MPRAAEKKNSMLIYFLLCRNVPTYSHENGNVKLATEGKDCFFNQSLSNVSERLNTDTPPSVLTAHKDTIIDS